MTNFIPLTIKNTDSYVCPEDAPTLTFTGHVVDVVKEEDGLHFYAAYEDREDDHENRITVIEICNGEHLFDIETFLNEKTLLEFIASYEAEKNEEEEA